MQDTLPLISVIMPVYNTEKYVGEAVESILNQTYTNFEFLIFDDASTDKSVQIINSFKDKRIQLITKPQNTGYTNSLNMGLTMAKGEYIARMDSDDISILNRFEEQVKFMENHLDVIVCGAWFKIINSDCIIKHPVCHDEIKISLLEYCSIGHPTVMMRKSFLKKNKLFYDTNFEPAEDYDFWVRISRFGKLHNIDKVLVNYRLHGNQVSNLYSKQQNKLSTTIQLNLLNQIGTNEPMIYGLNRLEKTNLESSFFIALEKKINQLKQLKDNNEVLYVFSPTLFNNFIKNVIENLTNNFFHDSRAYNLSSLRDLIFKSFIYLPYLNKLMLYKYLLKCIIRPK